MIKARIDAENPDANMGSYDETCEGFEWSEMEKAFSWHETGKINIVHEAIDRWASDPQRQGKTALIFEKAGHVEEFTYLDLKEKSNQWANLLARYGFDTGDRFFIFLPPCPEIYFCILACARMGILFCPVYDSFTFDELGVRLKDARPRGILTHPDLVEVIPVEAAESVSHVFLTEGPLPDVFPNEVLVSGVPEQMPKEFSNVWLKGDSPLYLSYTSGATGPPKGVVHGHHDMVGILMSGRFALDLREDTILWTDADPSWVTGSVYGAFAPWLCGCTSLVEGDPFEASNWYWTLEKHRVSTWYTTPRTIRRLMEAGDDLPGRYDFASLRNIATVGAPLVPDLFYWTKKHLGHAPHDTWWMTETGIISIANFPSMDIKPGSIGKPLPGVEAAILDESGEPMPPMSMGELALKVGWPGMMNGLWQDEARYQEYFRVEGWFLTGDIAIRDDEGYFYHQGRNDDLIKAGGDKVIGPYEIEQILAMHPAVAEGAVISKGVAPDQGVSFLKAFIALNRGFTPSARLKHEIVAFLRGSLSSDIVVKEIAIMDRLPRTRSGKLLRRALRAGELGLPV
ncbi:MAG: AMP-binding protein [Desulfatiglandaceae bacterium]